MVSELVKRSADDGKGGGEGNKLCKAGSKANSKSAKATGGSSLRGWWSEEDMQEDYTGRSEARSGEVKEQVSLNSTPPTLSILLGERG